MLPKINKPNGRQNEGRLLRDDYISAFLREMQYNTTPSTGSIFIFPSFSNHTDKSVVTKKASYADTQISILEQLQFLMDNVGLNISQLSDLLKVGRPTIYNWLDGADIRRGNLSRLEDLYYIFMPWNNKYDVKIGSHLYKKVDGKLSLYDLLMADIIEVARAKELSIRLNRILIGASDRAAERRKKLEDAGFSNVSKDRKNKVLDRLIRKA